MSDELANLQKQIELLQYTIASLASLPEAQAPLLEQLHAKQAALRKLQEASTSVQINGGAHAARDVNIAQVQTITNIGTAIYGRAPDDDERRRLGWYLRRLAHVFR